MKYQILRFQSEQEFQNFFGQLASAEISNFQAVEGSAGDSGFDGISDTTAYQVYYPEDKNRTDTNYIKKIDDDVAKIVKSSKELGLNIKEWILVVPEDLRIKVIVHLQKKSQETGLTCKHWGATKLTELITKHPHIQDSFPTIFLPPVREGIKDIQKTLDEGEQPRVLTSVNIIGDQEYLERRKIIINEYTEQTKSFIRVHGTSSSAYLAADMAYKKEADKKLKELQMEKEKSDRAYQLELDEINEYFEEQIRKVNDDMAKRGIYNSGIRLRKVGLLEVKKKRANERLNLKFGKQSQVDKAGGSESRG
jgi:hypothetical protein